MDVLSGNAMLFKLYLTVKGKAKQSLKTKEQFEHAQINDKSYPLRT